MKQLRMKGFTIPLFTFGVSIFLSSCLDGTENPGPSQSDILNQQIEEIEDYLEDNDLDGIEIGDGYYQVIIEEGTGENIEGPEIVELKYEVRKFDTNEAFIWDSSYVFIPDNGFYVPDIVGNVSSLNYANTLMKEGGVSDFYLASVHLFGSASGTFNDVKINANQIIKASYKIVEIRTEEEQRAFEDSLLQVELTNLGYEAEPTLSGLYRVVLTEGTGDDVVEEGDQVTIDYAGTFLDGAEFDSGEDVKFNLATLIDGWKEGLKGMKAGSEIVLLIPSHLAYGAKGSVSQGVVNIGSFEPLVFEITLHSFE